MIAHINVKVVKMKPLVLVALIILEKIPLLVAVKMAIIMYQNKNLANLVSHHVKLVLILLPVILVRIIST